MSTEDKNAILSLLNDAKPIVAQIQNEEEAKRAKGENFNLFDIMGINEREVYVCRVIGELLDPNGCHSLGSTFLSSFIDRVLNDKTLLHENLSTAKVLCEDSTHEGRRIDITIQIGTKIIPIEAKIKAGDQIGQCADYIEEIQRRLGSKSTPCIYYLTIDGHKPSLRSMTGTHNSIDYNTVKCISWKESIMKWLLDCLSKEDVQRRPIIQNNIWQLVDIIRDWGDFMDNKMFDIIKSKAYINEAIYVWRVIDKAKNELWNNLVSTLTSHMQKSGVHLESIGNPRYGECDFIYKEGVKENDKEIIISLVLYADSQATFLGFRTFNSDGSFCGDITIAGFTRERLKNEIPIKQSQCDILPPNSWKSWIYREKFPRFEGQDVDFKNFGNHTLKLLLKENMDKYVEVLGDKIKTFWGQKTS